MVSNADAREEGVLNVVRFKGEGRSEGGCCEDEAVDEEAIGM
jgi:hypothetical protein